jgi:hypothetical protein
MLEVDFMMMDGLVNVKALSYCLMMPLFLPFVPPCFP